MYLIYLQTFVKGYLISFLRLMLGIDAQENSGHLSSVRFSLLCVENLSLSSVRFSLLCVENLNLSSVRFSLLCVENLNSKEKRTLDRLRFSTHSR